MKRIWLVCAIVLAAGVVRAQDLDHLRALRQAAQAGNADAQLQMGVLYEYGYGLSQHDVPALAWYTLAARQGNALAAKRRDLLRAQMSPSAVAAARALRPSLSGAAGAAKTLPPPARTTTPVTPARAAPPAGAKP